MKSFNSKTSDNNGASAQKQPDDFFQAKLNVGQPGDKYELEADQMAEQVVGEMNGGSPVSKADHQVQSQQEEDVQTKETSETEGKQKPLAETITPVVQAKVEEEQVQEKEEEEELQKKEDEEVQMNSVAGSDEEDENNTGSLQAKSDQESSVSPQLESQIKLGTGGTEMDKSIRSSMESGFGADFSDVKVHTDSSAVQMSQELGAQAFTHGNDIYFNEGKYDPGSSAGQNLLAHELTHTIQQGSSGAIQGKMVQKEGEEDEIAQSGDNFDFTTNPPKIYVDNLPIPSFKQTFMSGDNNFRAREFSGGGREEENDPNQAGEWDSIASTGAAEKLLNGGLQNDQLYRITTSVRSGGRTKKFERNGDPNLLAENLKVPFWDDPSGEKEIYQIDHKQELQLKGWPRVRTAGGIDNLHLLSKEANRESGNLIKGNVNRTLISLIGADEDLKNALNARGVNTSRINNRTIDRNIKPNYDIHYRSFSQGQDPPNIKIWDKGKIESGDHVQKLLDREKGRRAISIYDFQDPDPNPSLPFDPHPASLNLENQIGSSSSYVLYWGDNLNARTKLDWNDPNLITQAASSNLFRPRLTMHGKFFNVESMQFDPQIESGQKGHLRGKPFKFRKGDRRILMLPEFFNWPIYKMPGTTYAGYLDSQDLKNFLNNSNAEFDLLSPFSIDNLMITDSGLIGSGTLLPSVPFISRSNVEIVITEDDVMLQKVFSSGDLDMPAPFSVSDVSLTLGYGIQNGFVIQGQVNFGIDQVGEGHIGASASTGGGFELEGAFNFDSELFDPAEINVEYKDNIWTIGGEIGIPEGKVRGVKSATINATYSENNFSATGEAELDIPGIERGSMSIQYGEEGFSIGGNFDLSSDIPGITGGNVEARVSKAQGDEEYSVFVSGTAQPDIPGISSSLSVTYENGVITLEGRASYERGMLSGTIEVGATNRAIGEDGEPTGEPDENFSVYGGGTLTLQLTPWLAATAGVKFTPEGEIEVTARLDADSYEVFSRREFNRNLFTVPTIEIPLFAIPLGPRSIGLVAQIGGGLDFSAGFGPGELRNMSAEITYNPEHEEETTVAGHGEFGIPADAGLTLRGDLSLGVSAGIASLTGGIELAGELGLEGEALASVDVNWSPQTGLAIDAEGRITVNPKFTFELNAFARASLGVGFLSVSETWRHNLASYEWGPDIQFGIVFPVEYREGEPFDMSFDDIEVIYPDLDVVNMAKGLARDVKNDLFD
ncbi:eCIS core domain-containing protein [Algoriphagus machipongonensis]|uniref:eCIS core domain-containing protein n=1 Tax=Algoriphagus machipongonensis TaxID=388413 RepID=A3HTA9_9BACT|nr:DUF4157 domain-containing protein [Algoriphagus machipongonensis]EAZ83077.1 hypothetical protein ALPR1_12690 [Algoriphagus machipongonensis]